VSAYQTGSVKVTVNSPEVIGTNTDFSTYVSSGDLFRVKGDAPFYQVAAINSATNLDLSSSYLNANYPASTELNALPYQIVVDYTPNYTLPELGANDTNFQNIYTQAMRLIDSNLFNLEASSIETKTITVTGSALTPYTPVLLKTDDYTITATDFGKILRMNSSDPKVFTFPSVTSSHDGANIELQKVGAGKMTASVPSGYYIADSSDGGTIYTESDYATLGLKYSTTASRWYISFANGTFTTT
jgi:hypothetical protein